MTMRSPTTKAGTILAVNEPHRARMVLDIEAEAHAQGVAQERERIAAGVEALHDAGHETPSGMGERGSGDDRYWDCVDRAVALRLINEPTRGDQP
jgi:hypothetical protein